MAQGVPRPEGLQAGAHRDLVHALHDLYQDAGMPSMRKMSRAIQDRDDFPDTVSHETIGQMLRGESTSGWVKYECVVRHLASIAVHRHDVDDTVARFHELWLAAVARAPVPAASTPTISTPGPAVSPPRPDGFERLPQRNHRFVGRTPLLRAIHEILRTAAQVVVLSGPGGVGKTQLLVEYAHRFRSHYDIVWWISAEHPSQLRASLAELATRLTLPRSRASQHPPELVLDALRRSQARWLLLFDNADAPGSLPSLANLGNGRVLLTSRAPSWAEAGSVVEVGAFEREESVALVRNRAPDVPPTEADQLANHLEDHPLTLEQTTDWHLATGIPVAEFLDRFNDRMREVRTTSAMENVDYPLALAAFLLVAFDEFERLPAATQLLELFAWLAAQPLSLTLLRSGRRGNVTSPLREALQDPMALQAEVRHLRQRGLIKVLDDGPTRLQVHSDMRKVLRDWLGELRLSRGRANVQAILAAANPGEPDDSRFWDHYAEVGPHVFEADVFDATDVEVRRVALDQMRYLFRIGHYEQSVTLGERLVANSAKPFDTLPLAADHHFHILAQHRLANAMRMVGRYAEARELTLDALRYVDDHPSLDPHDEYVANLDRNRAADLRIAGRYEDALVVDEASLAKQLRVGADETDVIRVMRNNIGVNFRLLGRFTDAYDLDRIIVREWDETKGPNDPRALFARTNLARDLFCLGRYREALDQVREVLPAYRSVVGENHHGVLLAVRTEVMALRKLGEHTAALQLAELNRHDCDLWFGQRHEYTIAARISLMNVRVAAEADHLGFARHESPHLLNACADLFGMVHPVTLAAQVNSAALRRAFDDLHVARRIDERAADQLNRMLGEDHPYTMCAMHNLAIDLALLSRRSEAQAMARTVLTRSKSVLGKDHPDTLACAVNLALRMEDDTALRTVGHSVESWKELLGSTHPRVLAANAGRWIGCDIEPPPT